MNNIFKVLVIDDSPFIFKAVKKALVSHGFEVVGHAENGKLGLEMFEKLMPDVITLDITMPIMDGMETAANLFKKNPNINVVMLSAMGDEVLIESARKIGVKHFLPKPFKAEELLTAVNTMINKI